MILSPYTRRDSPWVWIQWAARPGDRRRYVKTQVRADDPDRELKIRRELHRIEAGLLHQSPELGGGEGWAWVLPWLRASYDVHGSTLTTYEAQWQRLRDWLHQDDLNAPAVITRDDAFSYLDWRTSQIKPKSRKPISKNTAIGEIKLFGMIMREATRRHYISESPITSLRIHRDDAAQKPEITPAEELLP